MSKREFLARLKEALENDLEGRAVQENVEYYKSYIEDEMRKGRDEAEVIDELGDPWVIARSVIEMAEVQGTAGYESTGSYSYGEGYEQEDSNQGYEQRNIQTFQTVPKWKMILVIIGIIGVIFLIFTVVGGILSLIAPIILPVIFIVFLYNFIRRMR